MSFLYPRTIRVTRPQPRPGSSAVNPGYGGSAPEVEEPVAAGIPASIQYAATARNGTPQLPSDARALTDWKIFVPARALPKGTVTERDIVTDDDGKRYQVLAAYWNSMGYQIRASLLQV